MCDFPITETRDSPSAETSVFSPIEEAGAVAAILTSLIEESRDRKISQGEARQGALDFGKLFQSCQRPEISIGSYIYRIHHHSGARFEKLVCALIFIIRLISINPWFVLTELNIHRLFLVSLATAAKVCEEKSQNNAFHALIGGVGTSEMNTLEIAFLMLLQFEVFVDNETFIKYSGSVSDVIKRQRTGTACAEYVRAKAHLEENKFAPIRAPAWWETKTVSAT